MFSGLRPARRATPASAGSVAARRAQKGEAAEPRRDIRVDTAGDDSRYKRGRRSREVAEHPIADGEGQMPGAMDGDLESVPGRRKPWFLGPTAPDARMGSAHASRPGHKKPTNPTTPNRAATSESTPQEATLSTSVDADPRRLEAAIVDGEGRDPGGKDADLKSDPGRRKPWFLGPTAPNAPYGALTRVDQAMKSRVDQAIEGSPGGRRYASPSRRAKIIFPEGL